MDPWSSRVFPHSRHRNQLTTDFAPDPHLVVAARSLSTEYRVQVRGDQAVRIRPAEQVVSRFGALDSATFVLYIAQLVSHHLFLLLDTSFPWLVFNYCLLFLEGIILCPLGSFFPVGALSMWKICVHSLRNFLCFFCAKRPLPADCKRFVLQVFKRHK